MKNGKKKKTHPEIGKEVGHNSLLRREEWEFYWDYLEK